MGRYACSSVCPQIHFLQPLNQFEPNWKDGILWPWKLSVSITSRNTAHYFEYKHCWFIAPGPQVRFLYLLSIFFFFVCQHTFYSWKCCPLFTAESHRTLQIIFVVFYICCITVAKVQVFSLTFFASLHIKEICIYLHIKKHYGSVMLSIPLSICSTI